MAKKTTSSSGLESIECSDQPLGLCFHPERETIVAAALVDGTLEVHDFQQILSNHKDPTVEEDDEDDTILSSTAVHTQTIPVRRRSSNNNDDDDDSNDSNSRPSKKASCRAVLFSNMSPTRLYTGGSAGDLVCIDAERVCTFRSETSDTIEWKISAASVGSSLYNPMHVLHQMPPLCSKGNLIVSGDDHGGVRLWDERLCETQSVLDNNNTNLQERYQQRQRQQQNSNSTSSGSGLRLPPGCVLSWKEHEDYISDLAHSQDGNTLLATSSDGCLSIFDIRKSSTSNILQNSQYVTKSDPQDDELLSMAILKNGKKVVVGTHEGVVAIWSWGTWGDISDRYPTVCSSKKGTSMDALLKVDEDTFLTGTSDGRIRVVTIHPNKVLGVLGDHDHGYPIESLGFSANRKYVGSCSHDPYIRLWDTKNLLLHDNHDDEDEGEGDKKQSAIVIERKRPAPPLMARPPAAKVNRGGQASDDEWDDMDDEDEDEDKEDDDDSDERKEDDDDNDDDDDDSDDDSDDEKRPSKSESRANKLNQTKQFFADL